MLEKIGYNDEIFVLVGELLGKFHNATETFHHHSYDGYCHFLCMENWDSIEEEFELQVDQGILSDPRRIELCHKAINDLRKDVFDKRINFKPGFIHSDFNETNILLEKINEKEYKLSGLLDLGDFHYSLLIFDIATTILYLTFDSKINDWRNVAKHIVQGYTKNRKPYDLDYILVSMRARLASSLIYALRTSRINYRNEDMSYILKMQQNGWEFLEKLTVEYDQLPTFSAVIFT
uniref:Aminoglycoside phosphotransferase domain-containing protein n=1 Tax=Panagrolaimus sp. JU765 TaxID=591449 RepID=A0AC34RT89_9BILA